MLAAILITGILLTAVLFVVYKAVYDIFLFSRKDLVHTLNELHYYDIKISSPDHEDRYCIFSDKPISILSYMKVPLFYVHFFLLNVRMSMVRNADLLRVLHRDT